MKTKQKKSKWGFFLKYKYLFAFVFILFLGLYLRFYKIEQIQSFGWDQARDAWLVRDIINGKIVLNGPRTGVGHFHLGPLWYYLLVPFYYFSNMDPASANYLNILVNIFNFIAVYYVTKKIYGEKNALFATLLFATNKYLIEINRVSWNVSPVIGVAILIFYGILKIINNENYQWIPIIFFLLGLFIHLHFTFVFIVPIILISFLFTKNKKRTLFLSLISLPLILLWYIPNFLYDIQSKNTNVGLFNNFLKDYFINAFHLRFFLYRINDGFIQYQALFQLPKTILLFKFIIPSIFVLISFFEKNNKVRILNLLLILWFIVPSIGYSFYGGATSEYYMLMNSILVFYTVIYLQNKLLNFKIKIIPYILIIFWIIFIFFQTRSFWINRDYSGGLMKQKKSVLQRIKDNNKIGYNEGVIDSYLWQIWVEDR